MLGLTISSSSSTKHYFFCPCFLHLPTGHQVQTLVDRSVSSTGSAASAAWAFSPSALTAPTSSSTPAPPAGEWPAWPGPPGPHPCFQEGVRIPRARGDLGDGAVCHGVAPRHRPTLHSGAYIKNRISESSVSNPES